MDKITEALTLALEALEHEAEIGNDDAYRRERDAIREALAEPSEALASGANEQPAPAPELREQQEPVAWVHFESWVTGKYWPDDCFSALPVDGWHPLYTSPPAGARTEDGCSAASKPFVGLTDEEVAVMMMESWGCASIAPRHAPAFARAIEAKLREKNEHREKNA